MNMTYSMYDHCVGYGRRLTDHSLPCLQLKKLCCSVFYWTVTKQFLEQVFSTITIDHSGARQTIFFFFFLHVTIMCNHVEHVWYSVKLPLHCRLHPNNLTMVFILDLSPPVWKTLRSNRLVAFDHTHKQMWIEE